MALADLGLPISFVGQRFRFQLAGPGAQAHGAAQLFDAAQFAQLIDDAVRRRRIEFAGVGLFQSTYMARELDARGLHAQTDTKVRHLIFTRVLNALQHAFDAAFAEAARYQDSIDMFELGLHALIFLLQAFGLDPVHVELQVVSQRAVHQRFL